MLSDHAVLQRDRPIHIWGWDAPGAAVTIDFRRQHAATHADELGAWSVYLNPEPAGGPDTLAVHGSTEIALTDILVGDVWFASGQSNMEIPLNGFPGSAVIKDADKEIASANDPAVCGQTRLLLFDKKSNDFPLDDQPSSWTACNSTTAANVFRRRLLLRSRDPRARAHPHRPDRLHLGRHAHRVLDLARRARLRRQLHAGLRAARPLRRSSTRARRTHRLRAPRDRRRQSRRPARTQFNWHPNQASWEPAFLFNGMIAPAVPYTIRGFLWYQGETDSNPGNQNPQLYCAPASPH